MPKRPSIKGSIVATHAEYLKKYIETSQVAQHTLQKRFEPGDLEILLGPIEATGWYDIELYRRMMEFMRDYPGGRDNAYLVDAGRRSAENLIRAGIHQQFEYLRRTQYAERTDARERYLAFGRDLRLLTTITGSILNFLVESGVIEDPDHPNRWIIQHKQASAYPEVLCWTSQGFCNRMAEEHGDPELWYWERPRHDVVRFRMNRDL